MKYKVIIDTQAKEDMREMFLYAFTNDSLKVANKLLDKIEETYFRLEKFPCRGHVHEELKTTGIKRYLEIHCKPYRIIHEIKKN